MLSEKDLVHVAVALETQVESSSAEPQEDPERQTMLMTPCFYGTRNVCLFFHLWCLMDPRIL